VPSVQSIPGGGSLATRELLAGKVDYFCSNVAAIKPYIEANRLKAPAVFSRTRLASSHPRLCVFRLGAAGSYSGCCLPFWLDE
jgi:tripartite-type tricarboxylate transporter receptor subunit TctC